MSTRPIDARLFTTEPTLRLIGGRQRATGRLVFPLPPDEANFEPVLLPPIGTLWSYTVQRIQPKSPPYHGRTPFEPFALGYVELPNALIVEARLTGVEFDRLRVGMPMELTTVPLYTDESGATVTVYAFRPSGAKSS